MTPAELRAALQRLHISQAHLGRLTGKDPVTVNRWANGRLSVPVYVETILKLIEYLKIPVGTTAGIETGRIINGE